MSTRKIVKIDEDKCNGCEACIPNCHEGALKIIGGKARLVSEVYCDGLGACIGHCPQGAITLVDVPENVHSGFSGCPGTRTIELKNKASNNTEPALSGNSRSALRQWPVQLKLVGVSAPFFNGADILVAADCVPFAYPDFHRDLLKGKVVLIGCPKLDDLAFYKEKIAQILKSNQIRSVTYAHMAVPCCFGLIGAIEGAITESGKHIPFKDVTVGIDGGLSQ
jgi:ferredoxin